ncbi:MAG: hypothetical protein V1808_01670 [Candidatus Daviesbacteria bacterium]
MDEDTNTIVDTQTSSEAGEANVIINMESMIKTLITSIDNLTEELGKHQDMLDDILNNDSTFKEHFEQAKQAAKIKSVTKQQILKQPQAADLANKVRTMRSEIKEQKASLSDYLREFQRMSGINEIEGEDGELRQIVYVAKLVKKSSRD